MTERRGSDREFYHQMLATQEAILRAMRTWAWSLAYISVLLTAWLALKIMGVL